MNVFPLAIPLTAVFGLTNLCGSSFPGLSCFTLDASAYLLPLGASDSVLHLIVFAHRFGFPLTDAASHKLWTVGFSHVDSLYEFLLVDIKISNISSHSAEKSGFLPLF